MALHCNIDAKGKLIRLVYGVALVVVGGVLMFAWALRGGGAIGWLLSLIAIAGGAFAIFESRKGWCAIRAMGIRTPF
jgi:hypothetical protein